jgi:hypothetical protein
MPTGGTGTDGTVTVGTVGIVTVGTVRTVTVGTVGTVTIGTVGTVTVGTVGRVGTVTDGVGIAGTCTDELVGTDTVSDGTVGALLARACIAKSGSSPKASTVTATIERAPRAGHPVAPGPCRVPDGLPLIALWIYPSLTNSKRGCLIADRARTPKSHQAPAQIHGRPKDQR